MSLILLNINPLLSLFKAWDGHFIVAFELPRLDNRQSLFAHPGKSLCPLFECHITSGSEGSVSSSGDLHRTVLCDQHNSALCEYGRS